MKNRIQLSPKVSNKVSVKRTLIYAATGAGIFALLFIGAFFYFNLGSSEDSIATVPIPTVNAIVDNGKWGESTTWLEGRTPENNDTIKIPENITVLIDKDFALSHVTLIVFGTLKFTKAKLTLDNLSNIILYDGSEIIAEGKEGHNHIKIGNAQWKTGNINDFETPIFLDYDSPTEGEEIPEEKLPPDLLPIVLQHFNASVTTTNTVLIEWATFSEKDNDFFTLEHSINGKTFEEIAKVDGAGNSNHKLSYHFEDTHPVAGMNYYRLKQTDFNGDFEYFKIVGVHNSAPGKTTPIADIQISNAWPNPFNDQINISFQAETNGEMEVLIQNALGEIVHKGFFPFHYGENTYIYRNADRLQSGLYIVNFWQNGKKYEPQRLIKM